MDFWGVEVRGGELFDVKIGKGNILHVTQASLGEVNEEIKESVYLYITVGDKKFVLATLHPKRLPQQLLNQTFDHDFQISHNRKNKSVYFYGYKSVISVYESVKEEEKPEKQSDDAAHSCKSCNRNFKTEDALSSHNRAKHTRRRH